MGTAKCIIVLSVGVACNLALLPGCAANSAAEQPQAEEQSLQLGAMRLQFVAVAPDCWHACLTLTETAEGMPVVGVEPEDWDLRDSLAEVLAPFLDSNLRRVVDLSAVAAEEGLLIKDLPAGTYTANLCQPRRDDCWHLEWPPQEVREIEVVPQKIAGVLLGIALGREPLLWDPRYEDEDEPDQ